MLNISVDELLNISAAETLNISLQVLNTTGNKQTPVKTEGAEGGIIERYNRIFLLVKRNVYFVVPAAILIICGLPVLLWSCCCRGRFGRKAPHGSPTKESDEASLMLQGNGSSQIEVYDMRDPSDPEDVLNPDDVYDSSNPYEFQFTRYAIESMVPDIIDEDEPDLS